MIHDATDLSTAIAEASTKDACAHHGAVDLPRIAKAVREILFAIGEDPDREGLLDTPQRVARAWRDLTAGLRESPTRHLARVFEHEGDGPVIVRDIEFYSMCEHHLLPFHGRAHVAYIPDGKRVVGLSKLARTVEAFARRPQLQERLTRQIADAINDELDPRGVLVAVEAGHMCMQMRGVEKSGGSMITHTAHGELEDLARQNQILDLMGVGRQA